MKKALILLPLLVLFAGCSRPVVKETVVEKPVVVDRPVPAAAGSTAAPLGCSYAGSAYSSGAMACQADRFQYRCNNGNWERTLSSC